MKLNPGERSILASFEDGGEAEKAKAALMEAGFGEVQLDRVDGFPGGRTTDDDMRPGLGETSEVTALMTGNGRMAYDDARVLLNAMPEASGMSGAPTQIVPPFLVTVVTNDQEVQRALEIVRSHGGRA